MVVVVVVVMVIVRGGVGFLVRSKKMWRRERDWQKVMLGFGEGGTE